MSATDDETAHDDRHGGGSPCRGAVWGAVLATVAMIAVAALRGHWDSWLLVGAAVAVALGALLGRPRRGARTHLLKARSRQPAEISRPGVAEALLAHIPDPVILVDRRVIVVEANAAAHALLPGLKTRHPLSFALRSPDVLGGIDKVLAAGEPLRVEYAEWVPTERVFEVHIGPLRSDAPDIEVQSGVVLFFRDLTSARRLEAMRADFVANASHELRTPLASLLGFIDTLLGPARNDAAARERFLGIMRDQAQRMKRLIDDLLSLSRIEMRAHVPPTDRVDLAAVAAQTIETLTPLARDRGVELRRHLPAGDRKSVV